MKVAFNASQLLSPLTGIGQYTLNLGRALGALNEVDLEFFTPMRGAETEGDSQDAWNFSSRWSNDGCRFRMNSAGRFSSAISRLESNDFDLTWYHEPSFLPFRFEGRTVITVHDLS